MGCQEIQDSTADVADQRLDYTLGQKNVKQGLEQLEFSLLPPLPVSRSTDWNLSLEWVWEFPSKSVKFSVSKSFCQREMAFWICFICACWHYQNAGPSDKPSGILWEIKKIQGTHHILVTQVLNILSSPSFFQFSKSCFHLEKNKINKNTHQTQFGSVDWIKILNVKHKTMQFLEKIFGNKTRKINL